VIQYFPPDWVIAEAMKEVEGVTMEDVVGSKKSHARAAGRFVLSICLKEFTPMSHPEISNAIGERSHSTVFHRNGIGRRIVAVHLMLERVRARLLKRLHEGKDPILPQECRRASV